MAQSGPGRKSLVSVCFFLVFYICSIPPFTPLLGLSVYTFGPHIFSLTFLDRYHTVYYFIHSSIEPQLSHINYLALSPSRPIDENPHISFFLKKKKKFFS
ncbi:hypothetical protein QBC42DRAFT_257794 [Cladorrhinum samala]|uniref:Uncharacterized protein n=1 Tax=Cladorrhinum samala TaxID=585594 RepID=A0AAV9I2D5_9PEZI|nr:hypothetical protein QBC42DRAFT_257794 [Cladorrhinum samala]